MSITVRNTFPYKNKYFDNNDSIEQQLTDYIMHKFTFNNNFNISGFLSLATATAVADALNASSLFNATSTATASEETDNTTGETIIFRKITITT